MKWKPISLLVIMTFFGLWLLFALAYWLMEMINSRHCHYCNWLDLQECYKMDKCVVGVHNFSTALLFSMETMTTIGYGSRALTENCPFVILLATFQSLLGMIITGIMTGLVMSKFKAHVTRRKDFISVLARRRWFLRGTGICNNWQSPCRT